MRLLIIFSFLMTVLSGCNDSGSPKVHNGAMVLAFSWQPAFCETRPRVRECRSQKAGRYDTTHFSLHGLWPQPGQNVYCGVDAGAVKTDKARRWRDLTGLVLSDNLRQRLFKVMPGVQSFLHRHEWVKHGTCYSESPETYFAHSVALMDAINASPVRNLFAKSVGKSLDNQKIQAVFDAAFGKGVGQRVRVSCRPDGDRTLIVELTLGLKGAIGDAPDIGALAMASSPTRPGCPFGIVDPVGFQ